MIWVDIPEFPGYRINLEADVMSTKYASGPRILKTQVNSRTGHVQLQLRQNGKTIVCRVCILMAQTFLGPSPPGLQPCHNDGNKLNNKLGNLHYGVPASPPSGNSHWQARRTACDRGHDYTPENTMWRWASPGKSSGIRYRKCRRCHADSVAAWRKKKAQA